MTRFYYKAKKGPRNHIENFIDAGNVDDAVYKIIRQGLSPIDVKEFKDKRKKDYNLLKFSSPFFKKVKQKELGIFTRQISDLVVAKVSVVRALIIVRDQTKNVYFSEIMHNIYKFVKDGGDFSSALSLYPNVFSSLYFNMVKSGELSGHLDVVLERLADYLEKEEEMRSQIISSLAYPLFILIVGVITMLVLVAFVIPQLILVFDDLGQELPLITVLLINFSDIFLKFWWIILGVLFIVFFWIRGEYLSEKGRRFIDDGLLKFPFYGELIKIIEISRFSRTLSTLIKSGVSITLALDSAVLTIENVALKKRLSSAVNQVTKGSTLERALKKCAIFPEYALSMIAVGEETGRIENGLERIAVTFERRAEYITKTMISFIGPVILVIIVMFIGLVIIAMLLPIFNMNVLV